MLFNVNEIGLVYLYAVLKGRLAFKRKRMLLWMVLSNTTLVKQLTLQVFVSETANTCWCQCFEAQIFVSAFGQLWATVCLWLVTLRVPWPVVYVVARNMIVLHTHLVTQKESQYLL
jgi:hypothetical protein